MSALRKTLTATAVVTLTVTGSAACGTVENLSAAQKIDRAFGRLGEEKSLSFEIGLNADAATLRALDSGAEPGDELSRPFAELLSEARVTVSVESAKPLKDSGEKDLKGIAVKVADARSELAEYRLVDEHVYVRADAEAYAKLAGFPLPDPAGLPREAGALGKALKGEWLKFPVKDFRQGRGGGERERLGVKEQRKYAGLLAGVISREVRFTTARGTDGAETVKATASLRALVTGLVEEVRPLSGKLRQPGALPTAKELKELPAEKVTADFSLRNGALEKVSVDLAKLTRKPAVTTFGLELAFGEGGKVTAPAGAHAVTVEELMAARVAGAGRSLLEEAGVPAGDEQSPEEFAEEFSEKFSGEFPEEFPEEGVEFSEGGSFSWSEAKA
ncbi:hypothetical protein [Streptomyces clavuligerus]|uniref:Lipoprotein n=1 Tax=Streptomyces clavuligerus TaxID=1901 RepID=E2Q5X6_STRCL|nr:hypothetical protein [Streptomyces clavuligerus]ANW21680.1 hypothetical protein BB341_27440 [Streptomyces clavuligerus]AXU16309.1 hypothetical protein D1794_28510 [Streptomyces clavuligerus]EFG05136.1 Hypothetical protein SCLAV_0060 [Streptomyces clavuligerus]MBY6306470.1 hypothetical protein [Streptomyces clavuligerus]QCS09089.1 hypothetical protein CRV15_27870 [Streptomyces clavuligerus]